VVSRFASTACARGKNPFESLDSDKLIRDVMVYSFKTVAVAATVTKRIAYRFILSAAVLVFAACGVRGPLTVNPKPIKGLDGLAAPTPTDLRAVPSSAVLYGSDGKQTLIVPPSTKTE
jgi:hypothetical protein